MSVCPSGAHAMAQIKLHYKCNLVVPLEHFQTPNLSLIAGPYYLKVWIRDHELNHDIQCIADMWRKYGFSLTTSGQQSRPTSTGPFFNTKWRTLKSLDMYCSDSAEGGWHKLYPVSLGLSE